MKNVHYNSLPSEHLQKSSSNICTILFQIFYFIPIRGGHYRLQNIIKCFHRIYHLNLRILLAKKETLKAQISSTKCQNLTLFLEHPPYFVVKAFQCPRAFARYSSLILSLLLKVNNGVGATLSVLKG